MPAAWKNKQQKHTGAQEPRVKQPKDEKVTVKLRMKTDYMDVAKKGELYETDSVKAEQLVSLGRAEYVK